MKQLNTKLNTTQHTQPKASTSNKKKLTTKNGVYANAVTQ